MRILCNDYPPGKAETIPEAITTIPAGTPRLLFALISYRAKARKEMRRKPPIVPRLPSLDFPAGLRVPR